MRGKRVRFKDSEGETDPYASCRFDATSGPCEAPEDMPGPSTTSNEPKTSEFAFYKRLKQKIGHASSRKPLNRESISTRNFGSSNHARESGNLKLKDSSQHIKKPTNGDVGSFLSDRDAGLESAFEDSAMPRKEYDNENFKCSSVMRTPTSINLNSFLSAPTNASANSENQQRDGDIFSYKRLKLLQRIAKTLFPEVDEVPKECNLVSLLLSRLLPESSQDTLSQNPQLRQPQTKEICQLHVDSNIQVEEAPDTSRKLVKARKDHFLDSGDSAYQSHRIWGTLLSGPTVEEHDTCTARNSYRMLLEHKEGNEQQRSLNGIASRCWSNRVGDRELLTWNNELYDYSTSASTSHKFLNNEAYKEFSYDTYNNSPCRFRDQDHSYEVLYGSYNSFAASENTGLAYKDEIHDFYLERGSHSDPYSWHDSCSGVSFERSRPASSNAPDYLSDVEIKRGPHPLLLGWDSDRLDVHDSTHNRHMKLEIYHPSSSTCSEDHQDSSELEIYTSSKDHWEKLEDSTLFHLSSYTNQDYDFQGHFFQQNDLVPRSPCVPVRLSHQSYGPEQFNPDNPSLFMNASRGRSFFIPRIGGWSMENTMYERNCPALEAFFSSRDFESDSGLNCKLLAGILMEQNDMSTDNALELCGQKNLSSLFPISYDNNQPGYITTRTSVLD